jgi:hypothetical protein
MCHRASCDRASNGSVLCAPKLSASAKSCLLQAWRESNRRSQTNFAPTRKMSILPASRTRLIGVGRSVPRRAAAYANVLSVCAAVAENISLPSHGRAVGIHVHSCTPQEGRAASRRSDQAVRPLCDCSPRTIAASWPPFPIPSPIDRSTVETHRPSPAQSHADTGGLV